MVDLGLATSIIRVGMAAIALNAQLHGASETRRGRYSAQKSRDLICSLATTAAMVNEAIRLAQEQMRVLRPLAARAGASSELLEAMGQVCAGKHPASPVLKRARKQVG